MFEAFINTFLVVLGLNFFIFAVVGVNWAFEHRQAVYLGLSAIFISLVGSIIYLGFVFHTQGFWPIWFLVLAALVALIWGIWEYFFITIPADPPSVGVMTVWGERRLIYGQDSYGEWKAMGVYYVKEGLRLHAPYFPFFLGYIVIDITKRNRDMNPMTVWCKREEESDSDPSLMGAQMAVSISYTWTPDPDRLYMFLQTGEDEGVEEIIPDVIEEDVREVAQENYWEKFLPLHKDLTKKIINRLTGEKEATAIINGSSDTQAMGILVYRLNVTSINPVDEELKESITAFSREKRERHAEVYEMQTEAQQANVLMEEARQAGNPITFDQAYALLKRYKLAREGKINARHFSFEGLDSLIPALKSLAGEGKKIIS